MGERHPNDSSEQVAAEEFMILSLEKHLGMKGRLKKDPIKMGKTSVCVDGFSIEEGVLCEAWAHQGAPKSAQKHKLPADAFKLAFVSEAVLPSARRILLLCDHQAAKAFQGTIWMATAIAAAKIEIVVVDLPEEIRRRVLQAQARQTMHNNVGDQVAPEVGQGT
jgi:hypothetical protein